MRAIEYYMKKHGWQVSRWEKETVQSLILDETLEIIEVGEFKVHKKLHDNLLDWLGIKGERASEKYSEGRK